MFSFGSFAGESGTYDVDLEFLTDVNCLNSAHPRIRVVASRSPYEGFTAILLWACLLIASSGGFLVVITAGQPRFERAIVRGHLPWKRRPAPARPFSGFSYIGLITSLTYLVIFIPTWMIFQVSHPTPKGLQVRLVGPGTAAQSSPGIEPLLVRVEHPEGSRQPSLFVDSRPVSWEELDEVLQRELKLRPPNWPVYVQGDPELDWGEVAAVIDTITGSHAEVVLLTRKSAGALPPPR